MSWCSECRICDSLRIQPKSCFLWIVLRDWQCTRYHFRLESISPSSLVLVRVLCSGRLQPLEIGEVEGLLNVGNELSFPEFWHGCWRGIFNDSSDLGMFTMSALLEPYIEPICFPGSLDLGFAVAEWCGPRMMWGGWVHSCNYGGVFHPSDRAIVVQGVPTIGLQMNVDLGGGSELMNIPGFICLCCYERQTCSIVLLCPDLDTFANWAD